MNKIDDKNWAIVSAGGKQHLAVVGTKIVVNQVETKEGETMQAPDALHNQTVSLKVLRHFQGEKIRGLKFKNKVRYLKRYGHRQQLSELEVVSIGAAAAKAESAPVKSAPKAPATTPKAKAASTKKVVAKKPAKEKANG